jgi:hypothetical protein
MGRTHRHRDVWIAAACVLIAAAIAVPTTDWMGSSGEVGFHSLKFWLSPLTLGSFAVGLLGAYMVAALIRGWPLPGGFEPDRAAQLVLASLGERWAFLMRPSSLTWPARQTGRGSSILRTPLGSMRLCAC